MSDCIFCSDVTNLLNHINAGLDTEQRWSLTSAEEDKMVFDPSLETPAILSTLEWLDFGRVVKQQLEDREELTGTLWKKPHLPSNPKIFQYFA